MFYSNGIYDGIVQFISARGGVVGVDDIAASYFDETGQIASATTIRIYLSKLAKENRIKRMAQGKYAPLDFQTPNPPTLRDALMAMVVPHGGKERGFYPSMAKRALASIRPTTKEAVTELANALCAAGHLSCAVFNGVPYYSRGSKAYIPDSVIKTPGAPKVAPQAPAAPKPAYHNPKLSLQAANHGEPAFPAPRNPPPVLGPEANPPGRTPAPKRTPVPKKEKAVAQPQPSGSPQPSSSTRPSSTTLRHGADVYSPKPSGKPGSGFSSSI